MIQLFNGMQSSLSMVYDREMGSMKTMLVSTIPRWFLLVSKLLAGVFVSILQVYAFLIIASFWEIIPPLSGYITILPALMISGLMLGSLGMFLSSAIKQLENFAGVMNFVIFPMFFISSALMIASLFVEAGPAAAGWTIYPPLSALPQAQPGSGLGMTLWLVSMTIFIASSLLGSLNYIVTVINLRTIISCDFLCNSLI